MPKTLPANYTPGDAALLARVASDIVYDGAGGSQVLNQNHNWLVAHRIRSHVAQSWITTGVRSAAGAFNIHLSYRMTPRRHVPRFMIRVNADCSGAGLGGEVRVSSPAGVQTFVFNGVMTAAGEQSAAIACTNTIPPTTQLVTVELRVTTAAWIDLRRLAIRDDDLVVGDLP